MVLTTTYPLSRVFTAIFLDKSSSPSLLGISSLELSPSPLGSFAKIAKLRGGLARAQLAQFSRKSYDPGYRRCPKSGKSRCLPHLAIPWHVRVVLPNGLRHG